MAAQGMYRGTAHGRVWFTMRLLLLFQCACIAFAGLVGAGKPNILILFADDLGYGDVGFTGHPTIRTPNIDKLAHNGLRFTQFYSGAPICSPSRAALLTGRLPIRNGVYTNSTYPADNIWRVFSPYSPHSLPESEVTVADALGTAGYTSAVVGKWHLGHNNALPTLRGFDHFFGLPYSYVMLSQGVKKDLGCPPGLDPEPLPCGEWYKYSLPPTPLFENTTIIEQPVHLDTLVPRYNERAIEFMSSAVKRSQPFFLLMAYDEVHVPLFSSSKFENTSRRGPFGDAVNEMDHSIGVLLSVVEDLGVAENTLVFFTSDNGPFKKQDVNGGSSSLFKGQKGSTYEGGFREPAVAYWPGVIQGGTVNSNISSAMDLFVTALEVAEVPLPSDRAIDGVSLMSAFKGGSVERECYFMYRQHNLQATRCGPYKAHFITRCGYCSEPPVPHDPPLLYNVEEDPGEQYPLDPTQYKDVIDHIAEVTAVHMSGIEAGLAQQPQLNGVDPRVLPCCSWASLCRCTSADADVGEELHSTAWNWDPSAALFGEIARAGVFPNGEVLDPSQLDEQRLLEYMSRFQ